VQYDGATFRASPNRMIGRNGHAVKAVCLHVTDGPAGNEYASAVSWFLNPASEVSAHFVTSPAGDITQCVDTANTAFANGLSYYARLGDFPKAVGWVWQGAGWYSPRKQLVRPSWQLLTQGVNPNDETLSIESAAQTGHALPAAQWGALYALLRWLGARYPQLLPYVPGRTLIGHFMLDPLGRSQCPGSAFNLAAIAATANGSPAYAPGVYEFAGLPVYESATRKGKIAGYLPSDSTFEIDAVDAAPDYAPGTGHLSSGAGFVEMAQVRRKL